MPQAVDAKLTTAERESAWNDLASTDAAKARGAVNCLSREPEAAAIREVESREKLDADRRQIVAARRR